MIRLVKDFRLIPIVLVATSSLFVLKTVGLLFDGGYLLANVGSRSVGDSDITGSLGRPPVQTLPAAEPPIQRAPPSWAQQMFNFPEVTGSVHGSPPPAEGAAKETKPAPKAPPKEPDGKLVQLEPTKAPSATERAILERLQQRRTEIEGRSRDLETREGVLRAAEQKLEERVNELKDLEGRVSTAVQVKDDAEVARFKNLIMMYENMKAKDAARIFDRLDARVLIEVATKLNPRRMSEILALMQSDVAERLTVELATRAKDRPAAPVELPKIEGRPAP